MEKKKSTIIIFSTAYLPFLGGAETAIKGITDNLDDFHFVLLTSRFRKNLRREEKSGNILIYRLGIGNSLDKFFLPLLSFLKFYSIKKESHEPILFWGMMASYGSLGAFFLKIFFPKIPFLVSIQEGDQEWDKNGFWWWLIFKKADQITALSSFLVQEVRKVGYMGKLQIVPNGVDLQKFQNPNDELRKKPGSKIIISVSRRVHKNGMDILESAFKIVKGKYPEAELRILDRTPHDKVPEELALADIFVRPSRSEGFGTAFIEAMAAGLPIIATPVGGIKDFLVDRETGLEVKVDDPKDLAEKIELLFTDNFLRERLIVNGRKLVEDRYQWSKIAGDMDGIFKSMI